MPVWMRARISANWGPRWLIIWRAPASRTDGGRPVGRGMRRLGSKRDTVGSSSGGMGFGRPGDGRTGERLAATVRVVTVPQFGIFAQGTSAHEFIEFDIRADVGLPGVLRALGALRAPAVSAGGGTLVVGFGPGLWRAVAPAEAPTDLGPFQPLGSMGGHHAPATQHDFWLWISGSTRDVVFEHARAAALAVADVAEIASDHPAFVHRDSRDLTGFIDGSANPSPLEAPAAALIPDELAGGGGSHVLFMRWVHDLDRFEALPVEDQERVIGRSK